MKKSILYILSLVAVLFCGIIDSEAQNVSEIFNKMKSKINSASTISADFSMTVNGNTVTGKLKNKGKKFCLSSTLSGTWYNGSDMYTYVPGNAETTIVKPNASELAEANPLLYIGSASNFTVTSSKNNKNQIVLIPKKKGTGVKSVTITVDTKTLLPSKISVVPLSGSTLTLNIKNLKLNGSISDSEFSYPKGKYPNARIIDLR